MARVTTAALLCVALGGCAIEDLEVEAGEAAAKAAPPDAAQSTVEVSATSAVADGVDAITVTVTARDATGAPVKGWKVDLSATGGGTSFTKPGNTDASGIAVSQMTATVAGIKDIEAILGRGRIAVIVDAHPSVEFTSPLVSIEVTPDPASVAAGGTVQFIATGTFADGSTADITTVVVWTSDDTSVAVVSDAAGSEGVATGIAPGSATITAALDGVSDSAVLNVTSAILVAIEVTPPTAVVPVGVSTQYTATGIYSDGSTLDLTSSVVWTSSNAAIGVVSDAPGTEGLATGLSPGVTVIVASLGDIADPATLTVTDAVLESIEVTPATVAIAPGTTTQFTATGTYSDGSAFDITTSVVWTSSNPAIAVVSDAPGTEGVATALSPGVTTITAVLGGVSDSATLTVTNAVLVAIEVTPPLASISPGGTVQLTATGFYSDGSTADLTDVAVWFSSNPAVAVVSNVPPSAGLVSGLSPGVASVTAQVGSVSDTSSITVF